MLTVCNRHQFSALSECFATVPVGVVLEQLSSFLMSTEDVMPKLAVGLFRHLENVPNLSDAFEDQIARSLEHCNGRFLHAVLDFLERRVASRGFDSGNSFQQLHRDSRNACLATLVRECSQRTPDAIREVQDVLLGVVLEVSEGAWSKSCM
jgi:hypothetical protein